VNVAYEQNLFIFLLIQVVYYNVELLMKPCSFKYDNEVTVSA